MVQHKSEIHSLHKLDRRQVWQSNSVVGYRFGYAMGVLLDRLTTPVRPNCKKEMNQRLKNSGGCAIIAVLYGVPTLPRALDQSGLDNQEWSGLVRNVRWLHEGGK